MTIILNRIILDIRFRIIKQGGIIMEDMRTILCRLAIADNSVDNIYCNDMSRIGIKESELWLMHSLNDGKQHSQKQIYEECGFPKTTLNTEIKQAEKACYLTMTIIPGKRCEMNICLTETGEAYAERLLNIIYQAENKAMEKTLKCYSVNFIDAVEFFAKNLKYAFQEQMRGNRNEVTQR